MYYKISYVYTRCDWSVPCKHGSQHISQSYFIEKIENGCPVPLIQTPKRVWSNLKVLM